MAFTLKITATAFKNGPECPPVNVPNFPESGEEAIKMGLLDEMYDGYVRSKTIAIQDKMRRAYNGSNVGTRTKRGSAVAQAAAARAESMRNASLAAADNLDS